MYSPRNKSKYPVANTNNKLVMDMLMKKNQ